MHTTDIERIRAQVRQVADSADKIIEDADTIGDAGFDPAQSDKILDQQRELIDEVGQTLADFNELMNRAEVIESDVIRYNIDFNDLLITHNENTEEVTIEYSGNVSVPQNEVTVTKAGVEIDPFGSDVEPNTTVTIDVSGLTKGDEVVVEMTQHRKQTGHQIRPWEDVLGKPEASAPSINSGGLVLPEHNLVKNTKTTTRRKQI